MAGDHKCPVCQATFTRPQHVARHMRSHTGDRPYKCQHCGDQFARSDLLSRHINKCHANEKPPVTTAPNQRRKGAAAACRATTSKQACDQCVQSTLPCDGANPCSKCVQRKCRCTFVKFHRQTAPVGPGHQPPLRAPSELDSPLPPYGVGARYAQSAEYQLPLAGTDPSALALSGGLSSLYGPAHHPYAFNPAISSYGHHDAGSAMGAPGTSTDSQDFATRYRQHAEMLRRAGVLPPASVSVAPDVNSLSAGLLYNDALQQGRYGQQEQQASGWDRQQQHQPTHQDHTGYQGSERQIDSYDRFGYVDPSARHQMLEQQQQAQAQQYPYYGHGRHASMPDARRDSIDLSGSESSVSGEISSSASSNAHLPYDARSNYSSTSTRPSTAESPASATRALPPASQISHGHARSHSDNGHEDFRSAFGLMSLDDPNVLAGLASDAQPFFSMGLPTPTPAKERDARARAFDPLFPARAEDRKDGATSFSGTGLTPRELETRELRDFWKQYMRTPLTGGGPLGATPGLSSLTGILGEPSSTRPGLPKRGLSRVASLPSVKTPSVAMRDNFDYGAQGQGSMAAPPAPAPAGRTYTGANDDLRSYEAAVLSRRAPMTLNLQPRRGRAGSAVGIQNLTGGSSAYAGMQRDPVAGTSVSPELQHRSANMENVRAVSATYGSSRPASTLDGMDSRPSTGYMRPPSVPDISFRHASVLTDEGSGGSDTDVNAARPSFKRLASQTLGPDNAKRAALAGALGDEDDDAYAGQNSYGSVSPERPVVALPERYRRLSAPTAPAPTGLIGGYA